MVDEVYQWTGDEVAVVVESMTVMHTDGQQTHESNIKLL